MSEQRPARKRPSQIFVGRGAEIRDFRRVLNEAVNWQPAEAESAENSTEESPFSFNTDMQGPYIFLISGHGGLGKSTLVRAFQQIATTKPYLGRCQAAPTIAFNDEAGYSIETRDAVDPQLVINTIRTRLVPIGVKPRPLQVESERIERNSGPVAVGSSINQVGQAGNFVLIERELSAEEKEERRRRRLADDIDDLCSELRRISAYPNPPLFICLDTHLIEILIEVVDAQGGEGEVVDLAASSLLLIATPASAGGH